MAEFAVVARCTEFQSDKQGNDEHHETGQAVKIKSGSRRGDSRHWHAQRLQDSHETQGKIDQKYTLPAKMISEKATNDGAKGAGGHNDRGKVSLIAGPLARRDGLADPRLRQRHQSAAAEPLHYAGGDEHFHAAR